MASALTLLEQYHKDGEFLNHIIRLTGDEIWGSFVNVETKEQSKQWMHTHSPKKLKKLKQTLSTYQKADGIYFLGQEGVLMVEFMQQGTTVTSEVYYEALKNCIWLFKKKGMLWSSMTMRVRIEMLTLQHCWSISIGSYLTTLLTALISL
jgi:hypothetical protein